MVKEREGRVKGERRERKEEDRENGSIREPGLENNRTGSQGQERRAGEKGQETMDIRTEQGSKRAGQQHNRRVRQ